MRTCASCGRENPQEADFCSCGEYLRWEPTNFVKAVAPATTAPAEEGATAPAAPASAQPVHDPNATLAGDALPAARSWGAPAAPGGLGAGVAPAPGTPGSGDAPPGAASLTLRLPNDDSAAPGAVMVEVEPGQRVLIVGTIRNQSEVVDNFDMWIRGLPEGWWTVTPSTAYLVPYGSGGTYEQDLQIHIHPPRTPEAQARPWTFEVVAESRAYGGEVVAAPATVQIGPYFEVATELRPERGSGRLKARYRLIVRNKANARTEVALSAEDTDAECQFRFAEPKIVLEPGNALECPFTVFPPSQIWLGRPKERRFTVSAQPIGVESGTPPRMAVYRQKAWLPWWLAIVAPIVLVAAVLIIKLLPKPVAVPNVVGSASAFAAQQVLAKDGFTLAAQTVSVPDPKGKPIGSVAAQSPLPGVKAKKGTAIKLEVFAGSGKVKVPSIVGLSPGMADQELRSQSLALGAVQPKLNPNGKIASQIPLAGAFVPDGTAIAAFLASPASTKLAAGVATSTTGASTTAATSTTGAKGLTGAAVAGGVTAAGLSAAAAQAGKGSIVVPALTGDPTVAAAKLSQLGLVPTPVKDVSSAPVGQVAGTVPAAGAKVAKGAAIDLVISTGSPQLSFDNQQTITVINPTTQKVSGTVPAGTGPQVEASWSPDGTHVIYSQNGQLIIDRPNVPGAIPKQVSAAPSGTAYQNPSFAPTLDSLTIAFVARTATSAQLCFATIGDYVIHPSCTSGPPGFDLGGEVDWAPGGHVILVLGSKNKGANFGIVEFTSNVPYSTQASNWGNGNLMTDDSVAGQGVFDAQISPNGSEMALVAGSNSQGFNLYIVKANDFAPTQANELPVEACQVAWRPDGQELAVMQAHGLCGPDAIGTIVAVNPAKPTSSTTLTIDGAHPAWQPIATGS